MNREQWLLHALDRMRPWYEPFGGVPPVRVACGLPSVGAFSVKKRRVGECWNPAASADGVSEIFVSPTVADSVEVLGILAHEIVHAVVGCKHGHKGPFRRAALGIGLRGKMTATVPGDELAERLHALVGVLGAYPHATLDRSMRKKQGTRMLKVECPDCGYTCRVTRKWLDSSGTPTCPCGVRMIEVDAETGE
jgi:hypothetical protein